MNGKAVVETAIYVDDLDVTETFSRTVLGLRVVGKEVGRHVFFQVGDAGVLPAFRADATLKGDQLPPHGAAGPGHFALGIEAEDFDDWRDLLRGRGVAVEKEVGWPRGGKSLYFQSNKLRDLSVRRTIIGDAGPPCWRSSRPWSWESILPLGDRRRKAPQGARSRFGRGTGARLLTCRRGGPMARISP
jgi:catechol 2,3-dioxygenase-like lactoylglutathione lyase family enzyme